MGTRPRPPNNVRLTASSVWLLINVFHSASLSSLDYIRAMLMVGHLRIYFAWQLIDCCLRNFMFHLRR